MIGKENRKAQNKPISMDKSANWNGDVVTIETSSNLKNERINFIT